MDRNDLTQRRGFLEQRLSTLLQEEEPLDEYQQEEVVQTMATLQSYHDVWWTVRSSSAISAWYGGRCCGQRSFSILSLAMSVAFFADAVYQLCFPFTTVSVGCQRHALR